MTTTQLDADDLCELIHALQVRIDHVQWHLDDLSDSNFPNQRMLVRYGNEVKRSNELLDKLISLRREAFLAVHMQDNKAPYLK